MSILLDASVFVDAERGRLDLAKCLDTVADEPVAVSAITVADLLRATHRARTVDQRMARERFVEWIVQSIPVVPFGLGEARAHTSLRLELRAQGLTMDSHDIMIAATAVAGGFRLATADPRELHLIPGLAIVRWP